MNFEGKVALVSGAGSPNGIGQAIAINLAENGADIVVTDIEKGEPTHFQKMFGYDYGAHKGLDKVVSKITALGRNALAITADITKTEQVKNLIKATIKNFAHLDIVVNVAGGSWGSNYIDKYDEKLWIKTFDVNLFGTFRVVKYALPYLIKRKGTVVNISSIAAISHAEYLSAYDASKAGIVSLTASLAIEYGPKGVRSFVILPGSIKTDLYDMELKAASEILNISADDLVKKEIEVCPLRRIGEPTDIARVVTFLCSEKASFLNGVAIPVTGGTELRYPY